MATVVRRKDFQFAVKMGVQPHLNIIKEEELEANVVVMAVFLYVLKMDARLDKTTNKGE